jgi:hypothetical protein
VTPTQRSLKWLRDYGFRAEVVEKTVPHCKIRRDLFGFIDILAVRPGAILGVQTTSRAHKKDRLDKALALPALAEWLRAGGHFEVHGWANIGPRGAQKKWTLHRRPVTLAEALAAAVPETSPSEPYPPADP